MLGTVTSDDESQLLQTIEMFEVITQSQPDDYQSLEILKEAYLKLGRSKEAINTSRRIAEAYVQLGQLSSAILEYETILQHCPDDPEVLAAMAALESKATNLTALPLPEQQSAPKPTDSPRRAPRKRSAIEVDDGRDTMRKILVDGKILTLGDFDACWKTPDPNEPPEDIVEPFIQVLADKSILPVEQSLKAIADKTRIAYLPLERYDFDLDLARSFSKDVCRRWCILPFDRMSKSIMVATANPFNKTAAEDIQDATNQRILWYLASPVELTKVIRKIFRH